MKHIVNAALMLLSVGVASIYGQQKPVNITLSGTIVPSAINLGFGPVDVSAAGNGSLGPFTYRQISAGSSDMPVSSTTCAGPGKFFFPAGPGAGVFRFQDGSLLTVTITGGGTCIDVNVPEGIATTTYQITGGTGLFQNASGTLNFIGTAKPILFSALNAPVLFTLTAEFTGTIGF